MLTMIIIMIITVIIIRINDHDHGEYNGEYDDKYYLNLYDTIIKHYHDNDYKWQAVWWLHAYMHKTSDAGDNVTDNFLDFPPNLGIFRPF